MSFEHDLVRLLDIGIKKAGSGAALARIIKVATTTITRWHKDVTQLNMKAAVALADYLGVRLDFPEDNEQFVRVVSSASFGSFPVLEGMFSRKLLEGLNVVAEDCVYLRAIDPSMEPTIANGSSFLVNTRETTLADDSVFVVSYNDKVFIRRAFPNNVDGILLHSDNTIFPDIIITPDKNSQLTVLGRVCWVGITL